MSETKHTPGPWNVDPSYPGDVCAGTGHDVAVTCYKGMKPIDLDGTESTIGPQSREEAEANARLIAASPDLLAALQEWMSANREVAECGHDEQRAADEREQIAREMAAVAIAKATGETP